MNLTICARSINDKVYSLRDQIRRIEQHNAENQSLIDLLLPPKIATRIKQGEGVIVDPVSNVSILFTDLHRFSRLFESLNDEEVVYLLDELVDAFDDLADKYGLEKIKTLGDGYMAVCGLSVSRLDSDKRSIDCALEMLGHVRRFNYERGLNLDLRIGINTGDLTSGIVGKSRYVYDVWGESVNIAHRLKSACPPGNIVVSEYVRDRLSDLYEFEPFQIIEESDKESFVAWKLRNHLPAQTEQLEPSKNSQAAEKSETS